MSLIHLGPGNAAAHPAALIGHKHIDDIALKNIPLLFRQRTLAPFDHPLGDLQRSSVKTVIENEFAKKVVAVVFHGITWHHHSSPLLLISPAYGGRHERSVDPYSALAVTAAVASSITQRRARTSSTAPRPRPGKPSLIQSGYKNQVDQLSTVGTGLGTGPKMAGQNYCAPSFLTPIDIIIA